MASPWRRRIPVALLVLAALVLAAWLALPAVVAAMARRRLPLTLAPTLAVTAVATTPTRLPAAAIALLVVAASPGRIRTLAAALGQPIPPGLLREGLCARADWADPAIAADLPARLVAVVRGDADPPLVVAAVPAAPLAGLIARNLRSLDLPGILSLRWTYTLDPGSVLAHDGPPMPTPAGLRRRFRVQAAGTVVIRLQAGVCEVRVSRLTGSIDLDLDRRADGWRLHGVADVETLECRVVRCTSPLLQGMAGDLERLIEAMLGDLLSERSLEKAVLPSWFPTDLGLQAVVAAEPGDCTAAVAAMLPLD